MRAFLSSDCDCRCCQHSHLATRKTPSFVISFHPVSSHFAQVTRHGNSDHRFAITLLHAHAQKLHGRMTEPCELIARTIDFRGNSSGTSVAVALASTFTT